MTVLIMERASPGLRGLLSRWFLEPRAGVFVGTLSRRVRDLIWEKVCSQRKASALMMFRAANEQGFDVLTYGDPARVVVDADGLWLVMKPHQQ
jgi:CRISPR-associated protein Cas2